MDVSSTSDSLITPPHQATVSYKQKLKRLASQPRFAVLAALIFIVIGGGILALTQRSLKDSQETRSDASEDQPKIWAGFMSEPATAGAPPVGLSSINASPTQPSDVGIWLNNPYYKPLGAIALYVEYDPAVISLDTTLVSQTNLTQNQQPKTMAEEINASGTKKIDVLSVVAKCDTSACYPVRSNGTQWLKIANARISANSGFTGQTQLKILTNTDNSRSLVLATDSDTSLLQSNGFLTLDVNFGDTPPADPSPTPTGPAKPAKVTGLITQQFCSINGDEVGVALNWNQVAGATGYQVQFCKGNGCSNWDNLATNQDQNLYDHHDLSAGLHRYKVRAKNSAGNGAYSDIAQIQIGSTCAGVTPTITTTPVPGVPQKGVISNVVPNCTARKMQVDWNVIAGATKYQLQFCKGANCGGNTFSDLITSAQNFSGLSYIHENLIPGLFRYRMRGINSAGPGAWSNVQQARLESACAQATPTASTTPLLTATQLPTFTPQATETPIASPTQTPGFLAGDFDLDGNVSLAELQQVMDAYGQTGEVVENVNADNEVDLLDLTIVLANFLR